MKNTLRIVSRLGAAALLLVSQVVLANTDEQQPGTTGSDTTVGTGTGIVSDTDQPGKEGIAGTMPVDQSQVSDQQKMARKVELVPHAVVIESSLESAKDQLAGIRSQYELTDGQKDRSMVQGHVKLHAREIKDDLKMAMDHQSRLQGGVKKYPEFAQSGEFRGVNSSLTELNKTAQNWENKSKSAGYWNNKDQVTQDLDNFEKQIDSAISNAKSFESKATG